MFVKAGFRTSNRQEAEDAVLYWELKQKNLEAKICRIDPRNVILFDELFDKILDARDEIERLKALISGIRSNGYVEAGNGTEKPKA